MPISAGEVLTTFFGDTRPLETSAEKAGRVVDNYLRQANRSFNTFGAGSANSVRQLGDTLEDLFPSLNRISGMGVVTGGIGAGFLAAAQAGVRYRETLEKLQKSFAGLLGSEQAAAQHLRELQSFANRTPFEFADVARASQRFMAMGLSARDTVPYLTSIGNAVSRVGGGKEEIERVSRAIAQISARGKVSAEEMNQLADALVDGWRPLESYLGKTRGELFKMAEQGQISADTFLKAFRAAHEGGDAMQRQMNTLTGALSTLKDAGLLLLSDAFTPMHRAMTDIAVEAAKVATEGWNIERSWKAAASAYTLYWARTSSWGRMPARPGPDAGDLAAEDERLRSINEARRAAANLSTQVTDFGNAVPINPDTGRELGWGFEESMQKRAEAAREAQRETERQAGLLGALTGVMDRARIANQYFNKSEVEQQIALMYLNSGLETLTGSYRAHAREVLALTAIQMRDLSVKEEIKKAQKEQEELEERQDGMRKRAKETWADLLNIQETYLDRVNKLLVDDAVIGGINARTTALMRMTAVLLDAKKAAEGFELPPVGVMSGRDMGEGPRVSDAVNAEIFAPVDTREKHRQFMRELADDVNDIYGSAIYGIRDGWEGLWREMFDIAHRTLVQISQELINTLITGQRSNAGGIISFLSNPLGALLGGLGGGGASPGGLGAAFGGMGFATGTPSAPAGWAMVGEQGPELVRLRGGERIYSNRDTERMLNARPTTTVINNHTTVINYQPRAVPNSYTTRKSQRASFEALVAMVK